LNDSFQFAFIRADEGGERSAILFDYLRDVLTRLPKMTKHQIHTGTPAAWAAKQAQIKKTR